MPASWSDVVVRNLVGSLSGVPRRVHGEGPCIRRGRRRRRARYRPTGGPFFPEECPCRPPASPTISRPEPGRDPVAPPGCSSSARSPRWWSWSSSSSSWCSGSASELVVQQGEGRQGVHDLLPVLLDVGLADGQVLASGAHLRGDGEGPGCAGAQVGDRQLAGGRDVVLAGGAAHGQPHRGVHQRREDAAVQGPRRVEVLVGGLEPDGGPPVLRLARPGTEPFRETTGRCVVVHGVRPTHRSPDTPTGSPGSIAFVP